MFSSHSFFPSALLHLQMELEVLKCWKFKKRKEKKILSWYFRSKQRQKVPRDLMGGPLLNDFQLNFYRPMRLG